MTEVPGTYFDGRTSGARPVTVRFEDDGTLRILGDALDLSFSAAQVRLESRLGKAPRYLRLPDEARCQLNDNDAIDRAIAGWRSHRTGRWLHRFEASWRLALIAVVVLSAVAFVVIRFGLPLAAKHIAHKLPMAVSERIGTDTLKVLDRLIFAPSQLAPGRQAELHEQFSDLLSRQDDRYPYNLVFRASPRIGANAFALPNGTIVMTDELVALAEDDREIIAVLAHECGHVQGRHALRSLLQNSAVVVVITLATGDMSAVSAVGAALPTLLLEARYSRLFETEADAYGVRALEAAGIDPRHLADILERLTAGSGKVDEVLSYISSHPATKERIEAITGEKAAPVQPLAPTAVE